jgi:membrane protease YdiL (CAAX protease family)
VILGALLVGVVALWSRPTLIALADAPLVLAVLFGGLLALGLTMPVAGVVDGAVGDVDQRTTTTPKPAAARAVAVTAIGVVAVCGAQLVVGHAHTAPLAGRYVFLDIVAAVAEEAFFRRLLFGLLRPYGATLAIVGSAAAFAVVHLTTYGAWVLPLDFAVGLLFGWQREASGTWISPAITHVVANLLVVW